MSGYLLQASADWRVFNARPKSSFQGTDEPGWPFSAEWPKRTFQLDTGYRRIFEIITVDGERELATYGPGSHVGDKPVWRVLNVRAQTQTTLDWVHVVAWRETYNFL